jgi:hypothetical protein
MEPAGHGCFGLVHRSDLLEERHQIEVVAERLDLAVLDLDHLDRLDRYAFVRRRQLLTVGRRRIDG